MNRKLRIILFCGLLLSGCAAENQRLPAADAQTTTGSGRVVNLLRQMTLDEKISLLGAGFATQGIERLGIPALQMADGPLGIRSAAGTTAWPAGIAMAATFDPQLIGRLAHDLGEEARSLDKRLVFGPMINIARTPWAGRVFESFGEDPFLVGELTRAYVGGLQGMGVGATIKHLALNNQEWGRDRVDVHVGERALREIYLPGFQAGVEAGSVAVMAAYNRVNGEFCSENLHLLQDILKGEWDYPGFVISDWGATHSTLSAAWHGLDVEMPASAFFGAGLKQAVENGQIPMAVIDDKVQRVLGALDRLGLLPAQAANAGSFAGHHAETALQVARDSIVLLKNAQAVLPLPQQRPLKLAVLGPSADRVRAGGGSSQVADAVAVSALAGLTQRIRETGADVRLQVDADMRLPGDPLPVSPLVAGGFHGEFFNNPDLRGQPAWRPRTAALDFDWQWDSPGPNVGAENFSARWTAELVPRRTGRHGLHLAFNQAARVYLDDRLIYEHWQVDVNQAPLLETVLEQTLQAGRHYRLRVEYHKTFGLAGVQLDVREPPRGRPAGIAAAVAADYALVFVGQSARTESESYDRGSLRLSAEQERLILDAARANANTIVVVQAGSPVDMSAWADKVRGIVFAWFPGEQGGLAIADVLLGAVNPSGRLPVSFPAGWQASPAAAGYPGHDDVTVYDDGILVGYRYFDLHPAAMAYRFGHGLSYTRFAADIPEVTVHAAGTGNPDVEVRVRVANTGERAGAYVAQLYVGEPDAPLQRPVRELKGFKKLTLAAGEAAELRFRLDARAFRHYDAAGHGWVVSPGRYTVGLLSETGQPVAEQEIRLEAPAVRHAGTGDGQ